MLAAAGFHQHLLVCIDRRYGHDSGIGGRVERRRIRAVVAGSRDNHDRPRDDFADHGGKHGVIRPDDTHINDAHVRRHEIRQRDHDVAHAAAGCRGVAVDVDGDELRTGRRAVELRRAAHEQRRHRRAVLARHGSAVAAGDLRLPRRERGMFGVHAAVDQPDAHVDGFGQRVRGGHVAGVARRRRLHRDEQVIEVVAAARIRRAQIAQRAPCRYARRHEQRDHAIAERLECLVALGPVAACERLLQRLFVRRQGQDHRADDRRTLRVALDLSGVALQELPRPCAYGGQHRLHDAADFASHRRQRQISCRQPRQGKALCR